MLERGHAESAQSDVYLAGPDKAEQQSLGESATFAFQLLRRQYLVVLLLTVIAVGVGVIYLRVTPPTYTARAKVIIGTQTSQFNQQQSIYADRLLDSPQLESQ